MEEVLLAISLMIAIAAALAVLARMIKQPPIIAYLIAGILVGPLVFNIINPSTQSSGLFEIFARIGVAFLLFIVGLSLDLRVLKEVGGVATLGGISEIIITGLIGFLIALGLGFQNITAIYLGTALAFSSTVVVVKILSDKKQIDTLHGRIALGILIVEDFVAAIALMAVPLIAKGSNLQLIAEQLGMIILVTLAIFLFSKFILLRFLDYLARNQEALFLFGIAWALIIATLFNRLGFSLEIGALIAGVSLASSKYTLELGGKIKPLRDFFVVIFFIFFGSQLVALMSWSLVWKALVFSAFIIIGKPIIVMSILRLFGYKKRTNFLAGSSLAQISEFSLILVLIGYNLFQISQEMMSLVILISLITIGVSSYSIYYADSIFNFISRALNIFESSKKIKVEEDYEIILLGYHRIGFKVLQAIRKLNKKFVVVDYNPKVVLALNNWGINTIYGDAGDKYFLSELPLSKAKLIISTIPDESVNQIIREKLDESNSQATFIATAEQLRQASDLYKSGVDYVIIPHHLGGDYIAHIISQFKIDKAKYKELGKKHKSELGSGKSDSNFD